MDTQLGLKKILKKGVLTSELEFERASIIDRKLRLYLILIHKLLAIGIDQLIPATLNIQTIFKVRSVIAKLNNPKIHLNMEDLLPV
ncbi:MAG TPA: hypothetical protein VK541_19395 [Pedobacter sp.]|uniref:hypothetical protein n=1 Tax=Pedobacter sp. TaxID=1411316 RepID=UPI002CA257E3|nr:hypothetical protein [Pedobacter sp.]HMI04665.1 hypothetical protein [Pedobacter sp.]